MRPFAACLATCIALGLPLILSGCAAFPEVMAREGGGTGSYPAIAPLDELVAQGEGGAITDPGIAALEARAAGLRGRAAALRRSP